MRLQFCAILSQLHRHKEAFEQAQEGIKLSHLIIRDLISVCRLYSKKMDMIAHFGEMRGNKNHDRNKSQSDDLLVSNSKNRESKSSLFNEEDHQLSGDEDALSDLSISQFQNEKVFFNELETSCTLIEKNAKKLMPIYQEVLRKISVIESKRKDQDNNSIESSDNDKDKKGNKQKPDKPFECDLRHILGFLNQTEWVQNLNIGNIMQITPFKLEDLTHMRRNEELFSRENFLEIISFLIVGYFCASTEIRFIIQLKDEIPKFKNFKIDQKNKESEYWHTLSLDVAISFLPSDCPLLNHILLSFQKHHAPS